jgi:signal transduction histidine kinase
MIRIGTIWAGLVGTGTGGLMDRDPRKRVAKAVNILSLAFFVLNVTVGSSVAIFAWKTQVTLGVVTGILLAGTPILLNHFFRFRQACIYIYLIMSMATLFYGSIFGRTIESPLMVTYLIGVSLYLFADRPSRFICFFFAILILVLLEINFKYAYIKPIGFTDPVNVWLKCLSYLAMLLLVSVSFHLYAENNAGLLKREQENARKAEINFFKEEEENLIKDKFIKNASHEMKVSFHAIFSIVEIVLYRLKKTPGSQDLKQSVNDLRSACKISQSIVDNIFEYEKYQAGMTNFNRKNIFDMSLLVSNTIDVFKYVADEKNILIRHSVGPAIPKHIICDDVKIRQILTNLLHNAIKFAPNDSTILISADYKDNRLFLSVEDQGEGVSGDADIFQPFVTKNPDGLGLGLFIVKELVNVLGGDISLRSTPYIGTCFTVSLPIEINVSSPSTIRN